MRANKKILVTGGAGFIGSHLVNWLTQNNYAVVVLDNLSTGHSDAIKNAEFIRGDLSDREKLNTIFSAHSFAAVMHLAASSCVNDSVKHPEFYYQNNYANTLLLLEIMQKYNIKKMIFSSSASVYGEPIYTPIDTLHPLQPISPYGKSKLLVEEALTNLAQTTDFKFVSLRYFNAAGANPSAGLGERHYPETHLIPLCLQVAARRLPYLTVFGNSFPTPDGTAIRDYIHVQDIAEAHRLALEYLNNNESQIFNLGAEQGISIKEIINTVEKVTHCSIPVSYSSARAGDPAILIADAQLAKQQLGWVSQCSNIERIVQDAWEWEMMSVGVM